MLSPPSKSLAARFRPHVAENAPSFNYIMLQVILSISNLHKKPGLKSQNFDLTAQWECAILLSSRGEKVRRPKPEGAISG